MRRLSIKKAQGIKLKKYINLIFNKDFSNHKIMAQGKNKKNYKKGQKKKIIDPLSKKEWFQLRAPAPFQA